MVPVHIQVAMRGSVAVSRIGHREGLAEGEKKTMNEAVGKALKRLHYPIEVMQVCVRWYAAHSPSLRNLEEMMAERGVEVDHATVHRRAVKTAIRATVLRQRQRPVGPSWRMD